MKNCVGLVKHLMKQNLILNRLFCDASKFKNSYIYINYSKSSSIVYAPIFCNLLAPHNYMKTTCHFANNQVQLCWSCRKLLVDKIICTHCHYIQPISKNTSYFELFEINPPQYTINLKELNQKFRNFQSFLHPDKFTLKSTQEQEYSNEASSLINKAYSTLSDPLSRAIYLLRILGKPIEENNKYMMEEDFLNKMLEINQSLIEVENRKDLLQIENENNKLIEDLVKQLTLHFAKNDLENAYKDTLSLIFYYNIKTKIKELYFIS